MYSWCSRLTGEEPSTIRSNRSVTNTRCAGAIASRSRRAPIVVEAMVRRASPSGNNPPERRALRPDDLGQELGASTTRAQSRADGPCRLDRCTRERPADRDFFRPSSQPFSSSGRGQASWIDPGANNQFQPQRPCRIENRCERLGLATILDCHYCLPAHHAPTGDLLLRKAQIDSTAPECTP